jgi:site-specific DNA-methyltransferase (adenine-specific)
MDVQLIPLARLRAAPWNANRVSGATLAKIRRSIEEFGVVENLVARPHPAEADLLEVISGNHRLEILRELGHTNAPVVVVELDDALARILAQTLNRTRGKDDPLAYRRLLEELLMSATPADAAQFLPEAPAKLEQLLLAARADDLGDADAVPPIPAEPESQPGEVYELGPHRLLCGDATDPTQVELLVGTERPEVIWTDPPYGVGYVGGGRAEREGTTRKPIANDTPKATHALLRASLAAVDTVLAPSGRFYITGPPGSIEFRLAIIETGWQIHQTLVWTKQTMVLGHSDYHYQHEDVIYGWKPGRGRPGRGGQRGSRWYGDNAQTSVFAIDRPLSSPDHPTAKPVALIVPHLLNSSRPGEIVLDPFAGSGSTLIAAEQTGRRAFLLELDRHYCDVIRQRYAAYARAS